MTKIYEGTVCSTKMKDTVTVKVERKYRHPVYAKVVKSHKKYLAHNENLKLAVGDEVQIEETRPLSKTKHFRVIKKLEA